MGLDAHVYKTLDELPEDVRRVASTGNASTGELCIYNDEDYWAAGGDDVLYALHERLTNMAGAAWLSEELQRFHPRSDRKWFDEFLYSGTHCGDAITTEQMPLIEADLDLLRSTGRDLPDGVKEFVEAVERLVKAARARGYAIVF